MKIGFFEIDDKEIDTYKSSIADHEINFTQAALSNENIDQFTDLEIISVRSLSKLNKEILEKLNSLRFITTRTTGFDHIDLEYCKEKNITVSNVPEYGSYTVAEHTIALMLAVSRNLVKSVERTKAGNFSSVGLKGFELHGKTLGVIGVGSIGRSVIKISQAIGMSVIALTRHPDPELEKELNFKRVDLDTLLNESDVISLHIPHTDETHHMINMENINKFKRGSVLINTARGGIVDTEAILIGIDQGILRGAGLDVIEDEEKLSNNPFYSVLQQRENVTITPHNAYNSIESGKRIVDVTIENIKAFIDSTPQNKVTE